LPSRCGHDTLPREVRSWFIDNLRNTVPGLLSGLLCIVFLKLSTLYQYQVLLKFQKVVEEPHLENALLIIIWGLFSLPPRKWQPWVCGGFLLLAQAVAFLDVTYYRFFKDLPSLHLLPTWFQADEAGQSLSSVVTTQDAGLVVPLLLFPLLCLGGICRLERERERRKVAGSLIVVAGLSWFIATWFQMHPVRHEQLQRRFHNKAIGTVFGLQFYHFYDLYEWSRVQLGAEGGGLLDEELVRKVFEDSRRSSLEKTPFSGRYQGRDLILIQLESLENFAVEASYEGRPIMPFMNQARERAIHFRLFDQTHLGRSADGQFMFLNSLHPPATRPLPFAYPTNRYFGLPHLFNEAGYRTFYIEPMDPIFWNSGILSEHYGFQERLFKEDLPPENRARDLKGWGLTDFALFKKVIEIGSKVEQPYFMYVVTLMCHHPYSESSNTPVTSPPPKRLNMVRRYLRCCAARDRALKELAEELARTPRGRETVLCMVGDHDANLPTAELKKENYPIFPQNEEVPMILGSVEEILNLVPDAEMPEQPRFFGGQIDLAPTLGHVFSLNMEESVFAGWNLLATQNRGTLHARLGTWMDQAGKIQEQKGSGDSPQSDLFRVSEMVLRSDNLEVFRSGN